MTSTLIVQTDAGTVADANSYVDLTDFKAYHALRANSLGTSTDPQIEAAIIRAKDYLDQRFRYIGRKFNGPTQITEWPRIDAYDQDDMIISGIPNAVVEAACEYALRSLTDELNPDPVQDGIESITETLSPMSETIKYSAEEQLELPEYPAADLKLRRAGLVRSGRVGNVRRG
jgi:hypothetical protein